MVALVVLGLTGRASAETFGHDTVFGSTQANVNGRQIATQVTLSEDATVTSLTAYVGGQNGKDVRYAIYADSGGEPGTLISETGTAKTTSSMQWLEIDLPDSTVSAGTYWLAVSFDHKNHRYAYANTGGATRYNDNAAVSNGYVTNWGSSTTSNSRRISMYATYTPDSGGGGGPLTFGYDTVFGSQQNNANSQQIATQVTLGEDATVTKITAYVGNKADKSVRYALYADSGGEPGSLLAETAATLTTASMEWVEIDLPDTTIPAGTYWLALCLEHTQQRYAYTGSGGQTRQVGGDAVANGFSNPWGTPTAINTRRVSIYATYTPATIVGVYTDVSAAVGFNLTTTTGVASGSGLHWADVDDDGDLDAIITGNQSRQLTNMSAGTSFLSSVFGAGTRAAQGGWLDIDNDGDVDFWHRDRVLFQNDGGGSFFDVGDLGFSDPTNNEGLAAGDADGDGWCDVLMFSENANWIGRHQRTVIPSLLGASDTAFGLNDPGDFGNGDFCSSGDVNGDDFPDFFYHFGAGKLFLSDGDGTWTENNSGISVVTGTGDKFGSAWGDYDNDGDLDLFVPRYDSGSPGYLWRNDAGVFSDAAAAAGITDTSGQRSACWGDYDNDGDLDLYVVTHTATDNVLYENQGNGTFVPVNENVEAPGDGHDAVFVDYDNDGDLDLAVTRAATTNTLLRNDTDNSNFLKVRVIGWGAWGTNKAGIGVRVELYAADGVTFLARRDVGVARGFGGTEPLWVHFGGVAPASGYVVRVHFLSGSVDTAVVPQAVSSTIGGTLVPQMLTVIEPQPQISVIRWQEVDPR